jgi:hypothetical protein
MGGIGSFVAIAMPLDSQTAYHGDDVFLMLAKVNHPQQPLYLCTDCYGSV